MILNIIFLYLNYVIHAQRLEDDMTPSTSLKTKKATKWIQKMKGTGSDVDTILSLVHPSLFQIGANTVKKLKMMFSSENNVAKWPTSFTGIGVISNRKTPFHRDRGGAYPWYDILFAAGTYKSCLLELPDIDLAVGA